jgi:hypothetical protein
MTGRRTGLTLSLVIVAVLFCISVLAACSRVISDKRRPPANYDCQPREDDPEGYLLKICEYLNEEQINVGPKFDFGIRDIREDEYDGREVIMVILDCCGMGDYAYIDRETGEVLSYGLGAY